MLVPHAFETIICFTASNWLERDERRQRTIRAGVARWLSHCRGAVDRHAGGRGSGEGRDVIAKSAKFLEKERPLGIIVRNSYIPLVVNKGCERWECRPSPEFPSTINILRR